MIDLELTNAEGMRLFQLLSKHRGNDANLGRILYKLHRKLLRPATSRRFATPLSALKPLKWEDDD